MGTDFHRLTTIVLDCGMEVDAGPDGIEGVIYVPGTLEEP